MKLSKFCNNNKKGYYEFHFVPRYCVTVYFYLMKCFPAPMVVVNLKS